MPEAAGGQASYREQSLPFRRSSHRPSLTLIPQYRFTGRSRMSCWRM